MCGSQASRSQRCFGQRGSACGKLAHLGQAEDEEEAPPLEEEVGGDQSGSDLEGGEVVGIEIESVSGEGRSRRWVCYSRQRSTKCAPMV